MIDEPQRDPDGSAHSNVVMSAVGRRFTKSASMYASSTGVAIPVGILAALITIQYLTPAEFGELGLMMVLASFLTVIYNVGLLHGTFLWVYGSSGEAGDDLEIEGLGRAGVGAQRVAMGTGLILTLIVVSAGTALFFMISGPVADLLLGSRRYANLIGWTAISGGCGSIYRLTVNVFRFERRPAVFAAATIARPIGVLATSTALLIAGYGLWGALMGTVLPTIACAVACVLLARRSYSLRLSLTDAREIVVRGAAVVIPVVALFVAHSCDLYLVAIWVHGDALGIYRLASRLGTPPSYFASAVMMTWGPLERSALVTAAFKLHGHHRIRTLVNTYYVIGGVTIVVAFVLFSRLLILVAPLSYANAGKVAPLIAVAFVAYGSYIMLIRTVRPERLLLWYSITAATSAAAFVGCACLLIPLMGFYGAPVALTIGMLLGCAIVLWLNTLQEEPLPIQYGRISATVLVGATVSAISLAGYGAGRTLSAIASLIALLAYIPGLLLTGAIPPSHVPLLRGIVARRRAVSHRGATPSQLPRAERHALAEFQSKTLHHSERPVDYARLTRALRGIGGIGRPTSLDAEIGIYLASPEPESIRDFQMNELIEAGVDPYELHSLDELAKTTRKSRARPRHAPRHSSRSLRERARTLPTRERAQLANALTMLSQQNGNGAQSPIEAVRALRVIRRSLGVGSPSPSDLALARALHDGDERELSRQQRAELRELRMASKLTLPAAAGVHGPDN